MVVVSLFWFNRFADLKDFVSWYRVFAAYSHVRTEPLARHRGKKNPGKELTAMYATCAKASNAEISF